MTVALVSGHLMTYLNYCFGDEGTGEPAGVSLDTMGISDVL